MTSTCFVPDGDHLGLIIETNVAFTIKSTWVGCISFNVLDLFYPSPECFSESNFPCKRLASYVRPGAKGIYVVKDSVWLLSDVNQKRNVSETLNRSPQQNFMKATPVDPDLFNTDRQIWGNYRALYCVSSLRKGPKMKRNCGYTGVLISP